MLSFEDRQLVGVIACLERFLTDADEHGNVFFLQMLDKQHLRLKAALDRHTVSRSVLNEIMVFDSALSEPAN